MHPEASETPSRPPQQPMDDLLDDLPKLTDVLNVYLAEVVEKVVVAEARNKVNVRTSEFTVTDFSKTKRDRLWAMKVNGELLDSVLIASDGHRELLHLDMLLTLEEGMLPFYEAVPVDITMDLKGYLVDPSISSPILKELVYFAYHRRCSISEENAMLMASIGAKYRIGCLVEHCFAFLQEHCSLTNAVQAYKLALDATYANQKAAEFFEEFIKNNFEEIWLHRSTDLLALNYDTIARVLSWDKLNIKSESTVWHVIQNWTNVQRQVRLPHLAMLIKKCLRVGRLHADFIRTDILRNDLFLAQPEESQMEIIQLINHVTGELCKQTITDGHGLLYAKSIFYCRPRETRHFLLSAGGWLEGRTSNSVEIYDYQLNMWLSTGVKLPSAVSYFGLEFLDGVLYIFGGSNGREIFKAMSALDLTKPEPRWVGKCSMIERRCYVASVVLNQQLYALGGFNQQRRIRKCERYNQAMDSWFEIAELNYARSDASAATYKGRIFIAGGINDTNIEATVEVYNPETNTWLLVKAMSSPRTSFALIPYGTCIWAIGGNDSVRRLNSCESYDPETDTWSNESSLIDGRSTFRAICFTNELYVVGGYNSENPIRGVEKYVPNHGWVKCGPLLHERSGLSLASVPNDYSFIRQ